jgi:hypothetical protein
MNKFLSRRFVMDGIELGATRDSSGRFMPGTSGNPAGKRPGTRNRKTVLAEALRDGEDTSVARVVIDKALAGDGVAARFLLGLLSPKPRGRTIELDLPEDARAGDILAAFDATLAGMAAGEITPDEALIVTKVLDARRCALETLALERRLDAVARQPAKAAAEPEAQEAGDTLPERKESAVPRLHFACISPISAERPAAARNRLAATVPQRRAPVSTGGSTGGSAGVSPM